MDTEKNYIEKTPLVGWFLVVILFGIGVIMGWKEYQRENSSFATDAITYELQEQQIRFSIDSAQIIDKLHHSENREDSLSRLLTQQNKRHEIKIRYIFNIIPATDVDSLFAATMDDLGKTRFKRYTAQADSVGGR